MTSKIQICGQIFHDFDISKPRYYNLSKKFQLSVELK